MSLQRWMLTAVLTAAVFAPAILYSAEKKAATAEQYQVTGTVVAVDEQKVVVLKGEDKWEIDLTADTKSDGKMKEGDKVLIHYHMTANKIEAK